MEAYHYAEVAAREGAPLLILLHGTGGDENNLIDLGRSLMPDAHLIAPRGDVSEGGQLRFFRRTGMGVYDMDDLARATSKMAAFIDDRSAALKPSSVTALGYSNGANILASVLFGSPDLVDRAVLMHPLIPFAPPAQPALADRQVLITAGRRDPICPPKATEALAQYFAGQGAAMEIAWHDGGHELRREEIEAVKTFLG
jgi:phospholipase/carboxylesterase